MPRDTHGHHHQGHAEGLSFDRQARNFHRGCHEHAAQLQVRAIRSCRPPHRTRTNSPSASRSSGARYDHEITHGPSLPFFPPAAPAPPPAASTPSGSAMAPTSTCFAMAVLAI